MKFNFDNNLPIYIQLVEQLKIYIISGKLNIGERIPSVRELGSSIKVNPNTIQKALVELEEMNLIYTESTNGRFVTKDIKLIEKLKEEYANNITKKYYEDMSKIGYSKKDILNYIKKGNENGTS